MNSYAIVCQYKQFEQLRPRFFASPVRIKAKPKGRDLQMGITVKITPNSTGDTIELTDHSIIKFEKKLLSPALWVNRSLTKKVLTVHMVIDCRVPDQTGELVEIDAALKLADWANASVADDPYGSVEIELKGTEDNLYESFSMPKAFVLFYNENFSRIYSQSECSIDIVIREEVNR
jgi:hypothetical protein